MTSFKDSTPYYMLDTNDKSEYWRYLYDHKTSDKNPIGLLIFIEHFYRDYSVRELDDENLIDTTVRIRERLLAVINKIFLFLD